MHENLSRLERKGGRVDGRRMLLLGSWKGFDGLMTFGFEGWMRRRSGILLVKERNLKVGERRGMRGLLEYLCISARVWEIADGFGITKVDIYPYANSWNLQCPITVCRCDAKACQYSILATSRLYKNIIQDVPCYRRHSYVRTFLRIVATLYVGILKIESIL